MAGYTRQSAASIVNGSPITAPPLNAEFTQLVSALAASTGHKHDGTTAEGGYVPLIADSDAKNKIVADQTNNRFGVFVEVGTTPVEQVRFQDGAILPVTDSDIDLGGLNLEFKDLFIDGTAHIDTLDVDENASIAGTFAVTDTSIFTGAISAGSLTTTGNSIHATVDINGGAIDSTIIGASTAAAGSFTTVSTTGQATLATADINGGTIDGSVIGGATPQAVTGTIITANTGFSGALTGDVTGNVTSAGTSTFNNITATGTTTGTFVGDLTGNVTASSGTTTLNNLVVDGTVDFTSTALLNVSDPTTAQQAATKNYTDTADALKLNLAGGTMSGAVAMGTNKITGLGNPTDNQDAVSKFYADTSDALKLNLSGGTMSGAIAMGNSKITGLGTPTADTDAATKGFVDTSIANVIEAAPAALDTLNELAAALGDDANFSTTVTNSLATKLPLAGGTMTGDVTLGANKATSTATPATDDTLTRKGYVDDQDATKLALAGGTMSGDITLGSNSATSTATPTTDDTLTRKGYVDTNDALKLNLAGGTMSGAIAMGTSKITGLGDPTANQDAATKAYTDTQDATKLNLSGGTMTGNLVLGSNKATSTATPTSTDDLTRKGYVDSILGSATSSAASAAAASTSETNAATSETNAGNSAAAAAASLDSFDDRYLGAKSSAPSTDNDGDALTTGALYWNTTSADLHIWDGSNWQQGSFTAGSLLANVLEDTTPQLGGNLDLNTNNITGTGNVGITGNITLSGTVDGRDLSVDGAKLDGIESGATADQTKADIDALGIAASTAATLATSRNIAVSGAITGNANFDGSGNISITTTATSDPTVTLTGAVTGSGTMTNLGNVSIATTATADPTLTLSGDASGSATFTNLGNATLSVTVADDSHNHVISNVDGLQTALDGKLSTSGKAADSDLLDGFNSSQTEGGNTVAVRNSSGYLFSSYFNGSGTFSTSGISSGMGRFTGTNGTDTYGRSYTAAAARSLLNVADGATNVTNNNQLTNGAGYATTSAVNAAIAAAPGGTAFSAF
jgi:hypothetical protein